jgi:hypothetical protein
MGEAQFHPEKIEEIARLVAPLGWRLPRIRDLATARQVALGIHMALVNVASGRGALDIAIAESLAALSVGFRAMNLRFSNVYDYAREELGINASTAAKMERLARRLQGLPKIRDAVRRGDLTVRKAEIIARVARPENEACWLLRAKDSTVRGLRAEVETSPEPTKRSGSASPRRSIPASARSSTQASGCRMGDGKPTASKAERVTAWCQEYFSSGEVPPDDHADDAAFLRADEAESVKASLEEQYGKWADLVRAQPIRAPLESGEIDPWRIDLELRQRLEQRRRWDEVFGQLVVLFQSCRGWWQLGFATFGHYCDEVLGMGERTVAQRAGLEHGLCRYPALRQAAAGEADQLREGAADRTRCASG